jgi:hypothetical protein
MADQAQGPDIKTNAKKIVSLPEVRKADRIGGASS